MKKILVLAAAGMCIAFTSCLKSGSESQGCQAKSPQSEETVITNFCTSHNINAQKDANGIYYEITNAGQGVKPTASSKVFVTYKGTLLTDTQFDAQTDASKTGWTLGGLIPGWQVALPYISKGGSIRMVLPSYLGYGCYANGPIPANSPLYFEITLVDVQ
ncbi:MAG: FKBP-type peptidyl-prolyl cis-trans isomerase [Filimonas sp.]|nr:FKBP-type peptidyl-prolyl cis-trans isomerase [Filimonas sp.]